MASSEGKSPHNIIKQYIPIIYAFTRGMYLVGTPLALRKQTKIRKRGKLILREQGFIDNLGASYWVKTQIIKGERR
jgi:hypothetical protein